MKKYLVLLVFGLVSCGQGNHSTEYSDLALEVKKELLRSWNSYQEYAWGHDVLKPLSKSYDDWYSEPLYISPIDAYSSLKLMGFDKEAKEIEDYVVNELNWEKDVDAKIFEVNIRILGGLLAMYEQTENKLVLDKTVDFANRMMPAFNTLTGIPNYWVNLKTGVAHGDTVNVAEAATYTFEMGILSYYTKDPSYYQAAKKATMAIYDRRSDIGLIGSVINVQTGEWVSEDSHICAGVDSYYEYLYKSFFLFGDPDLGEVWDKSIKGIHNYLSDEVDGRLWYGRANMYTGDKAGSSAAIVTLYDAFFPAILALSGDIATAERYHSSWDWLWNQYGLEPMVYDYRENKLGYPAYDLNPEIIESAYYLRHFTKDDIYLEKAKQYWSDIMEHCSTDVAFASVEDVRTMEKKDYMPTFFFAETLKYLYLIFSDGKDFNFDDYMFNTEAHQFRISSFDKDEIKIRLGIE